MSDAADAILSHISSMIAAVGALGTASYGLVDTSKALRGGVSNVGIGSAG